MENPDINQLSTHGMHKSAIIYRDDSARYLYVCFHCGHTSNDFNDTLQHIESHFEIANVGVDQFTVEDQEEQFIDCPRVPSAGETVDFKIEILEQNDLDDNSMSSTKSESINESDEQHFRCKVCHSIYASKFLIRIHALNAHIQEQSLKCRRCSNMFKSHSDFESHLKLHIAKGEVSWTSGSDGIATPWDVDWSTYEELCATDSNGGLRIDDVMIKENVKRRPSDESTDVKKNRKRTAVPRVYTRPYKCHKCPQAWRYVNELRNHLKTHASDEMLQLYRCKECNCYYKNGFELRFHVLAVHLMMKHFKCNACCAEFNALQSKQFEEHLHQHQATNNTLWTNIGEGNDFTKYEETETFTEPKHPCEFCTQRFFIKCNLDVHMKTVHSGQRRLQCGQCDSVFTTPKYYFAHQLEHQRVGPNITERNDNILLANLDACIDERIIYDEDEYNERSYRCLICNNTFDMNYDIRSHIRERHVYKMFPPPMEPKKEFICDLCGMRLKTKAAVKNHLLIHTNTKSHACTICGKKFRQNSDRRIHERQHTGEKPFQCHECGKRFISKGLLTAHKKSHDDSTYPCPICGRVFNLPSGYRKHIQTHRQDRAFKCTICTKSFNTRIYLTKHMSIHAEKHYQCRFCELKFSTSDGQRQHQRYKHQYAPS